MQYNSLRHMIKCSSSSREFFRSLPRETQHILQKDNCIIRTQLQLRLKAEMAEQLRKKALI